MKRLKNYAVSSLVIALLVLPSTTSSQEQHPPETSTLRTSRLEPSQDPSTPATKFIKGKKNVIPNRYIVVLNDDVVSDDAPIDVRRARITEIATSHAETYGGKHDYIYETALKGYAIQLPNEAAAIAISTLPEVRWVEEDALGVFTQTNRASQVSLPVRRSCRFR